MNNIQQILLADDHWLFREGLKQLLEPVDDIRITADVSNGDEVLTVLAKENFDLVILDLNLPGIHGEELIVRIRINHPSLPILILSMHNEPPIAKRMLQIGANGFITKGNSPLELLDAIHKVVMGKRFIASEIAEEIFFNATSRTDIVAHEFLSPREFLILRMLAKGETVNEIAQKLNLSIKTISTHKTHLMAKMNITNFAALIQYAMAHGLAV
jgi:DNA-binding NarL/FixJ family response regulator